MPIQHKMSKKQIVPQEDVKNCQINRRPLKSKMCSDKKCHDNTNMWPVKPQMDMRLKNPAKLQSSYKNKDELKYVYEDKNYQDTICDGKQKKIGKKLSNK